MRNEIPESIMVEINALESFMTRERAVRDSDAAYEAEMQRIQREIYESDRNYDYYDSRGK